MKGFLRSNLWRSATWLLIASLFLHAPSATAGLIGHPSAVCGAVLMTTDELEANIAKDAANYESRVFTANESELRKIYKRFEGQPIDDIRHANDAIDRFLTRSQSKEFKTSSYLFSGENAEQFLKDCGMNGKEIVDKALQNKFTKPWVITLFGVRAAMSVYAAYQFAENGHPVMAMLTAFGVFAMGRPVVRALLSLPQSGFEKFLIEETARVARKGARSTALNVLSLTGKRSTDFTVQVTAKGNRIESFSHEIIFEKTPLFAPHFRQIGREITKPLRDPKTFEKLKAAVKDPLEEFPKLSNPYKDWENPLHIPQAENRVDFIAMPGPDGERSILVLVAEGVE